MQFIIKLWVNEITVGKPPAVMTGESGNCNTSAGISMAEPTSPPWAAALWTVTMSASAPAENAFLAWEVLVTVAKTFPRRTWPPRLSSRPFQDLCWSMEPPIPGPPQRYPPRWAWGGWCRSQRGGQGRAPGRAGSSSESCPGTTDPWQGFRPRHLPTTNPSPSCATSWSSTVSEIHFITTRPSPWISRYIKIDEIKKKKSICVGSYGWSERATERRATERQSDRATERQSDRATERWSDGSTEQQSDGVMEQQSDRATERQIDRSTERQNDRTTERQNNEATKQRSRKD